MLAQFKHLFLPQESNNYRAKILHHQSLSFITTGFLIVQLALSSILLVGPKVLGYASQISPERVVELTNQERAKNGAPLVVLNPLLVEAAQRKAGDMFAFDYWAHVSPSGRKPWDFFREVGYDFSFAGENLARDFPSAEEVVNAWMASSTHKENVVNGKYREIGIAVVDGTLNGVQTTLVVQLFGTPTPQARLPEEVSAATTVGPSTLSQNELSPSLGQAIVYSPEGKTSLPVILSRVTGREIVSLNPFALSKTIGFSILGILAGILLLDAFFIWRQGVIRLSGRSVAHVLFSLSAILIILLSRQGVIL